jgi:hypothetical protein
MKKIVVAAFLLCFIQGFAKDQPIPDELKNAKTAIVHNAGAVTKDFDKLVKLLKEWGRFEIIENTTKADIAIELSAQSQVKTIRLPSTAGGLGGVNSQQVMISYLRILNGKDGNPLYSAETEDSSDPKMLVVNLKNKLKKAK